MKEAMECYRQTLDVLTRESMLHDRALTQMSRGNILWNRISGDRSLNIEEAIK